VTETYYDLLGVAPDASTAEIEQAYRERLKETHPDVSDAADAGARTRQLIEARDVLTDGTERARYDRLGHEAYVGLDDDEPWASRGADHSADRTAGAARGGPDGSPGAAGRAADAAAGAAGSGPGSANDDAPGQGDNRSTGAREHVGSPSWSGHQDARTGTARAWNPDSPYAVHRSEVDGRPFPDGHALALLAVTFVSYPVLVGGTLVPGFPLFVRFLVAGAALGVVAYVQSAPAVGLVVFGVWFVLGPAALVALGVSLLSVPGAVVVLSTAVPFGLSALTWLALR
jgi:hypothetical protein